MKFTRWTADEVQILRNAYKSRLPYEEIYSLLPHRTKCAISSKAGKLSLTDRREAARAKRFGRRKYSLNYDFFGSITPDSAYWAGFIAADGNIAEFPTPKLTITLNTRDRAHLEELRNLIGYTGKVYDGKSVCNGLAYPSSSLSMSVRPTTINDLARIFSITPNKSLTLLPPNLAELAHIASFIAGYIDGDGSINLCKRDNLMRLGVRGTLPILTWIKQQFDQWEPSKTMAKVSISDGYPKYQLCGNRFHKISKILLRHTPTYLARKWTSMTNLEC